MMQFLPTIKVQNSRDLMHINLGLCNTGKNKMQGLGFDTFLRNRRNVISSFLITFPKQTLHFTKYQ